MIPFFTIPLQPRGLLLFCCQKSKQKNMAAESASLKIGYTSLKIRNLPFYARCKNGFKQTDFFRFVPPIFLTLTSQGGNQGIAHAMDKNEIRLREIPFIKLQSLFSPSLCVLTPASQQVPANAFPFRQYYQ